MSAFATTSRMLFRVVVFHVFQTVVVVHSFQLVHHHHHHRNGRLLTRIYANLASVTSTESSSSSSSTPAFATVLTISQKKEHDANIFDEIAQYAGLCLLESDLCRDAIDKPANQTEFVAKGATNWIDDASSLRLHNVVNRITLNLQATSSGGGISNTDRDDAVSWMRWIKSIPCPAILDLTSDFQRAVALSVHKNPKSAKTLQLLEQNVDDFLQRFACRIILLPSGTPLSSPLVETSSSLIHGKLLYGGVTRSRLLQRQGQQQSQQQQQQQTTQQQQRLVGERQAIKTNVMDNVEAWTMFGGPPRMYQAMDMGPAAVLEVLILPRGTSVQTDISTISYTQQKQSIMSSSHSSSSNQNMILTGVPSTMWTPQKMFTHYQNLDAAEPTEAANANSAAAASTARCAASALYGRQRNEAFRSNFQSTVGGLQPQIDAIVRRVLDGRVIRPSDTDNDNNNRINGRQQINGRGGDGVDDDDLKSQERNLSMASLEAQELELLGLTPVRGLLLFGPPGCGKTALAREISRALRARTPKIVSAPELLDRWVGGSEKLVRALFAEAEAELAVCNGDARRSALHVIVIDEIDAVFRKRTAAEDSGEATRSSVVNQILAKLDGVNAIPNVLFVGMTNRRELLDEALLRPGRLEVQIEIPLPNKDGRREILQIHFNALRQRGRLSKPLCCAIDGVPFNRAGDDNDCALAGMSFADDEIALASKSLTVSKRKRVKTVLRNLARKAIMAARSSSSSAYDLAAKTEGYSGADIAGLVRSAGSLALARARKDGTGVQGLLITLEDVRQALLEVKKR